VNSLKCNCGCGCVVQDIRVIRFFTYCRDMNWHVSSTIRCRDWNRKSGGVPDSYHIKGLAVDFHFHPDINEWIYIGQVFEPTFIKMYPWGYHVDWR